MFERFVALARARRALKEGSWEQAVQLADDPMVRSHRRAEEVRRAALGKLLDRARERMERGELGDALCDCSRVLAWEGEFAGARGLMEEIRKRLQGERERGEAARSVITQARRAAEQGQLQLALDLLGNARELVTAAEVDDLERFVVQRRERGQAALASARQLFDEGHAEEAAAELRRARLLDGEVGQAGPLPRKLAAEMARRVRRSMRSHLDAGRPGAAFAEFGHARQGLPEIEAQDAITAELDRLGAALEKWARERLAGDDPMQAAREVLAADPRLWEEERWAELGQALRAVARADDLRARGSLAAAAEALDEANRTLRIAGLGGQAKSLRKEAGRIDSAIAEARRQAADGDLTRARAVLTAILQDWPTHEGARAELEILDQGVSDREQRLAAARELARAGRLREAKAKVLTLVGPAQGGEEARLLLKDLQARLDLVARGMDQVRSSLHGREAATAQGVRHLLLRIEQLAKICVDHDELPALKQALESELRGLELFELAESGFGRGDAGPAAEAVRDIVALRSKLLHEDRLDARMLALADRLVASAEEAVESGRLLQVEACLRGLGPAGTVRSDLAQRAEDLRLRADARRQRAEELAGQGLQALAHRDLAAAADRLSEARDLHVDGASVRRLAGELQRLDGQEGVLARVEELARERDYAGAQRQLSAMPPTPPALRTRIFDMKQSLARAQGLDGGFLLRVDEGGEFLVLRGETVTIGNVRDGKTDMPVLANVAGRHARIQRSMSFHGGMQDRLVAEGGEVRVGGASVREHKLKSGDKVQLGSSLRVEYSVPSSRSLTAALRLLGGFQVAGTDRVLLMKDRGRDGRILIGGARDVHVRIPGAQEEVEVFANRNGQVRVRFEGQGTMDGRQFSGEHPIEAGATVQCGGVTFVLLPWNRP